METVNIELTGDRSQVGSLKDENFTAYAELGNINEAGEYTLKINIASDNNIAFNIDSIVPAEATVKLDKIETRTFTVEASYPNIVVTAGHALDLEDVVIEPAAIDITGPSAQLSEIDRVVVYSDRKQEISGSYSLYTNQIQLYTKEGALLDIQDTPSLELPSIDFQISIPILTTKALQLTYDMIGVPTTFDTDWLKERLHLSVDTITLASQTSSAFANRDTLSIGFVRLSDIGLEYVTSFDIDPGEGLTNRSGIQQVTMTLDNDELSSKDFIISSDNINVINPPMNYDFDVITKQMTVTVIGLAEELEELDADDILVTVDLLNYDNADQTPSFSWPAVVSFYNKSRVWAYGSYRIDLDRIDQTTEETTETTEADTTE